MYAFDDVDISEATADILSASAEDGSLNLPDDGEESSVAPQAELDDNVLPFEKPQIVYHISDFDGPLDLLYQQIKDAQIDIEDIFISDITSQYVAIIDSTPREELDLDYAGEFIVMAAELVYLKSLRGLPKEDEEISEDDPAYERQLFINKLKEYALLKEQSEKLREVETINRFYRQPTYTDKDYRVALVNFSLPKLVEAFARVLANAEKRGQEVIPKKVMKDRLSVHEQMESIRAVIGERLEVEFTELFEEDYDKADIITTFLAVLELVKYGIISVAQQDTFGVIKLYALDNTLDAQINFEEGDDGKY